MREDRIRDCQTVKFVHRGEPEFIDVQLEIAAQIAESNEHLKRIADALEQLVHRGVPK